MTGGGIPTAAGKHPWGDAPTPYEALGGDEVVRALVDRFYDRIDAEEPELRALHPADDAGSRQKLYEFLSGWLGGPPLYQERRGHPRLRLRHVPFPIGTEEARAWLRCMFGALDDVGVREPLRRFLEGRFTQTALFVRNRE